MFNRCRKKLLTKFTCLHDKSPRQSRTEENISQYNIILQTHSQHQHPNWGKTQCRNETGMDTHKSGSS